MKRIILTSVLLCIMVSLSYADSGDRLDPQNNALWQLAAVGFVQKTIDAADNLSADWRSWEEIDILKGWLLVEAGQPLGDGGTGKIYKKGTYARFVSKFQNFSFGDSITVEINPVYGPPDDVTVVGTTISCDNPASGTVKLYKLISQTYFVEQADIGAINGDRLEFTGVASGLYVLGFSDDLNRLPTVLLTVS